MVAVRCESPQLPPKLEWIGRSEDGGPPPSANLLAIQTQPPSACTGLDPGPRTRFQPHNARDLVQAKSSLCPPHGLFRNREGGLGLTSGTRAEVARPLTLHPALSCPRRPPQ